MNKVLVDTSVVIDFLRQKEKLNTWYYQLAPQNIVLSILSQAELYSGKNVWTNPKAKKTLKTFLSGIELLNINSAIVQNAGKIRAKFGTHLIDALIASTALEYQLPIATLNTKDFSKIPKLKLIKQK